MKNFKKLLVALLAVVVLVAGTVLATTAADIRPVGSVAEAEMKLAAVGDAVNLTAKAQAMRELDTYMEEHQFHESTYNEFMIEYQLAQDDLQNESVELTSNYLDSVVDIYTDLDQAATTLEGVTKLLGKSSARGYYDTTSEAYAKLGRRAKVANALISLRRVMDAPTLLERGSNLKALVTAVGSGNFDTTLPEYETFILYYGPQKEAVSNELLTEATALANKTLGFNETDEVAAAASQSLQKMLNLCYFDTSSAAYLEIVAKKSVGDYYIAFREVRNAATDDEKAAKIRTFNTKFDASGLNSTNEYYTPLLNIVTEERKRLTAVIDAELDAILDPIPTYTKSADVNNALDEAKKILGKCYTASADSYYELISIYNCYNYIIELDAMPLDEAKAVRTKAIVSEVTAMKLNTKIEEGIAFKTEFDARTAVVLGWVYDTLDALAATATDEEADFNDVVAAENALEEGLTSYYVVTSDAKYSELCGKKLESIELIKQNTTEMIVAATEVAAAKEDDDEKYAAFEKIREDIETYGADTELPEIMNALTTATYEQLKVLIKKADTLMKDTQATYDDQVAAMSAVTKMQKDNALYIAADSDDYKAILDAFKPAQEAFISKTVVAGQPLLTASQGATGYDKVAKFKEVQAFVTLNNVTADTQEGADFLAAVATEKAAADAVIKAARDKIAAKIPLSEYSDTNINGPMTFEEGVSLSWTSNASTKTWYERDLEHGANGSNTSLKVVTTNGGKDSYFSTGLYGLNLGSCVLEFDITSFTGKNFSMYLETKAELKAGGTAWLGFARISGGNMTWYSKSGTIKTNMITVGAWTHVSFVFNAVTYDLECYVDYEYCGKMNFLEAGISEFNLPNIRIGTSYSGESTFSLDNITSYYGTAPREMDRFKNMSNEDYFLLSWNSVKTFLDDNESVPFGDAAAAYETCSTLFISLWDATGTTVDESYKGDPDYESVDDLKDALSEFDTFETATLNNTIKTLVYGKANEMLQEIQAMERGADTVWNRNSSITLLYNYLANNATYASSADPEYKLIDEAIAKIQSEMDFDQNVGEFVDLVNKLKNASNLNAKRAYAAMIEERYDLADIPDYEKDTLDEYNALVAAMTIEIAKEDTELFIGCMNKFAAYDNVADALKDYYDLTKFMELARAAYNRGNVQESAKGYSDAFKKYSLLQEAFYEQKQVEYVKTLNQLVQNYNDSVSFIEKEGITIYMRNFFETEDLDMTNASIKSLYSTLLIFEDSVDMLRESYETLLIQNTALFVSTVRRMKLTTDYLTLRALYNEATEAYYYMNVNEEEVIAATADYLAYVTYFSELDARCEDFIVKVAHIGTAANCKALYAALVAAYRVKEAGITDKYPGVAKALRTYEAAFTAYSLKVETHNNAFTASVENIYTVRVSYAGAKMAVAAFKKFYD